MIKNEKFVEFLYAHKAGKILLNIIFQCRLLKLAEVFLSSRLSKPLIKLYIEKNHIDMSDFRGQNYQSFQEFFARKRSNCAVDQTSSHLISPCDGLLCAYPISKESVYFMKGSSYRLKDLIKDKALAKLFYNGTCLIIRLRASDYHHFCYIDDGFQYANHFIQGALHSVQPIACSAVPVYRLNRRKWTLMDTKNFGKIAQIGIGALLVGEIIYKNSCQTFKRGEEMGHFELAGSTIVLLFQKNKICLNEDIQQEIEKGREVYVRMGEKIGTSF